MHFSIVALLLFVTASVQRVKGDERHRRTVALPPPRCNDWSDWINRNDPGNNTDEVERLTTQELDQICPPSAGGNITSLRCIDMKGEPFYNKVNATSGDGTYRYSCNKPDGATCYRIIKNASCPDLFVQFWCSCPAKSTVLAAILTTTTTTSQASVSTPRLRNGARTSATVTNSNETGTNSPVPDDVPRRNLLWLIPTVVAVVVVVGCCVVLTIFVMKKKNDNKTMSTE